MDTLASALGVLTAMITPAVLISACGARILQRAMVVFYMALGLFVATSVAIGVLAYVPRITWLPVVLGLSGASFLFYGSIILIVEARLAFRALMSEMDFVWRLSKHHAPADLVK